MCNMMQQRGKITLWTEQLDMSNQTPYAKLGNSKTTKYKYNSELMSRQLDQLLIRTPTKLSEYLVSK